MDNKYSKDKQNKNELEQSQTYKCADTLITVEPVFKKNGKRTLFHSLGHMVNKETQDS